MSSHRPFGILFVFLSFRFQLLKALLRAIPRLKPRWIGLGGEISSLERKQCSHGYGGSNSARPIEGNRVEPFNTNCTEC